MSRCSPQPLAASASNDPEVVTGASDLVAVVELAAPSQLGAPVDGDLARLDRRPRLGSVLDEAGELEQLAEPDHLVADLDRLGFGHGATVAAATAPRPWTGTRLAAST